MGLDQLLATSDIVSLHVPLTPETRHLIDQKALARMKRTAYLVNTARGPVVDEAALAWALRERLIAGAGLDVFEHEPRVHEDLLSFEQAVLTPHLGSATRETRLAMADLAVRNVIAVLQGEPPLTPIPIRADEDDCPPGSSPPAPPFAPHGRARRARHACLVARDRRHGAPGDREDLRVAGRGRVPGSHRDPALGAHAGRDHARGVDAAVPPRAHAADDGEAERGGDREADLSGELLPEQGALREGDGEALADDFGGRVPSTMEELMTLPGVGRKTANLVMILAFKSQQNICVDTHVHRISNRLGWVKTRTPEETEQALYAIGGCRAGGPTSTCIS